MSHRDLRGVAGVPTVSAWRKRLHKWSLLLALSAGITPAWTAIVGPVQLTEGTVIGTTGRDSSVAVFKGIPYAAPPVGSLRWKPPQPAAHWRRTRQTDQFGAACAQPAMRKPSQSMSEDCLYLNVWSAAARRDERRPVLVWIYGGGYMVGSASQRDYDGEALARKGVVVVTINYRVGPFGFLAMPELSRESPHHVSGNYGLLDMIAALHWVQRNIAAFGGDARRVTIAGQSSGAGSVLLLAQSPLAKGLFRGIIAQSGPRAIGDTIFVQSRPLANAERRGTRFANAHGAHSLRALRALSWQQILQGVAMDKADPGDDGDASLPVFRPVIDGWVLPLSTQDSYARGLQSDVPVLGGFNLDEMGAEPHPGFTLADLHRTAQQDYGAMTDELLQLYPATTDAQADEARKTIARERSRATTYLWATEWSAKAHRPLYLYFWTHAPGARGAFHGSEIPYVFDTLDDAAARDEDNREIAATVSSYWANFVLNANPNGASLPAWNAFDGRPQVMELGAHDGAMPVAEPARLDFMRRFFAAQKPW